MRSDAAAFALEETRLRRFEAQLANCKMVAPQSGMVVYANDRNGRFGQSQAAVEEGERLLAAARGQIDQERNQARESLRGEVAVLALSGAEQILMREVDAEAHREVLDKLVAEI